MVLPPPTDGPERWIDELEAKLQILRDEEEKHFLIDCLEELSRLMREEADLDGLIARLEDDLEHYVALEARTPPDVIDQVRGIIAELNLQISRYKSHRRQLRGS